MYINDKLMVNFQEDLEKGINILNKSEMLELDFDGWFTILVYRQSHH